VIFNNLGTFTKTSPIGTGTTAFPGNVLNNTGTVNITSGTLSLNPGSLTEAETSTFNVAGGAELDIAGGTTQLNAGLKLQGAGLYELDAGTLTFNTSISVANFTMTGGTQNGAATFTITAAFNWSNGTLNGSGTTTVVSGATLSLSSGNTKYLTGSHILNNQGTGTWTGTGEFDGSPGSTFNNSGTFAALSDTNFGNGGAGAGMIFNNTGTFNKSSPTGTGTTGFVGNTLNNFGTVNIVSGNLSVASLTNNIGFQSMLIDSGEFIEPNSGTLGIQVGGTPASALFSQLNVINNNSATLNGTLNVSLANGFTPTPGQVFPILTFGSSTGNFSTVHVPTANGSSVFSTSLKPTEYDLTAIASALPTPSAPTLLSADDSGIKGDNITNVKQPHLTGSGTLAGATIEIVSPSNTVLGMATVAGDGTYTVQFASPLADATYAVSVEVVQGANASAPSAPINLTILAATPATPAAPVLSSADDSGVKGDKATNVKQPHLTGTAIPGATIQIVNASNTVLGSATVAGDGTYSVRFASPLPLGGISVSVRLIDVAGNISAASPPITLTIVSAESAAAQTTDFDGDGKSDLGLFRVSTAQWLVGLTSGGFLSPAPSFGATNLFDIPVPGDYDGVGHAELAIFRPSTGQWIIQGHAPISFGATNLMDIPVPGDYDGVGHTELAVFRPSTGQWFIQGHAPISFGATNLFDLPVPGDYTGAGKTELAVFRPSTAQWIVQIPGGGTYMPTFGAPNLFDVPLNPADEALVALGKIHATSSATIQASSVSTKPSSSAALVIAPAEVSVKKPTTSAADVWSMAIDQLSHGMN
jgi:hypothetical protein